MRIALTVTAFSVLAMSTAGAATSCAPITHPSTTIQTTTAGHPAPATAPDFDVVCGNGAQVIQVRPDTPATRKQAAHYCAVTDQDINRIAGQFGMTPAPLHQVTQH